MKSHFDDVLTFIQVVEAGSITAAAARLNISKSVVSKRIGDLENRLGVELFRRSTRRVVPTDSGAALYEKMRALVAEFDNAVDEASLRTGALRGRLRITAPMSFGTMHLGPVLAAFARSHPELELTLDLDDRIIDLVGGGYDMAIRIGRLQDSSLVARKLCLSRRIVCCSPFYARARGLPASIEDLSAHQCIDYAHVQAGRLWQFEPLKPGGKPRAVMARSRITANNGEIMRDMALAGLGLAVLPLFIVHEQLRRGTLINALAAAVPLPDTIYAVYPPTRHISRRVRALIDHLAVALGDTPPWELAS
jgi:DNA-binding transcriptional LysR family regulator